MAATRREPVVLRRARRGILIALSGLAAALLLAALVPTVVKPRVTASQEPSTTASSPLTHYAIGWISFDYPSSWKSRVDVLSSVVAFWTGSEPAYCITATPQPTGPDSHCGRQGPLLPGTLYVTAGPYAASPIDPTDLSALPLGGQYVTVAGQSAILVSGRTAVEQTVDWSISEPKEPRSRLHVHAEFADPGAGEMRTEITAMVASIQFANAVKPLDLSQAKETAKRWIGPMHTIPGFGCFSTTPGEVTTGVVTESASNFHGETFQLNQLSKPLPVICRITIEPAMSVGLWKLTLTQSWTADVDRTAGSHTLVFWLDPDVSDLNVWLDGVGGGPDESGDPFPYST